MLVNGDTRVGRFTIHRNGRQKYSILLGCLILGIIVSTVILSRPQVANKEVSTVELSVKEQLELEKLGLTPRNPVVVRDDKGVERKIHGRFLHITDLHPDVYYTEGTSVNEICHGGKPNGKDDFAPRFGKPTSGCDSPMALVNETLRWIDQNLRDKIDFVLWTGDNIRHDSDRNFPRTEDHIFALNGHCAKLMHQIFGARHSKNPREFDVTVVPNIGNNDVFPHNLFSLGPTLQTREFYKLWAPFIPQDQLRTFHRSVSFVSEVIPGKLAVMSVNTLYLFKSNPLVDTCDSRKEPGYQLLLWMGSVLEELRRRGMKVWLCGHVPPTEKNMEGGCFHKYNLWVHEYRDIIVGGIYGHMNVDHFVPLDSEKSWEVINEGTNDHEDDENDGDDDNGDENNDDEYDNENNEEYDDNDDDEIFLKGADLVSTMGAKPVNKESYMKEVRKFYYTPIRKQVEKLEKNRATNVSSEKKKKKKKGPRTFEELFERYSVVNVAGSVIPTFNPSIRVWEYNTTGLDQEPLPQNQSWDEFYSKLEKIMSEDINVEKRKDGKPDKTIPKVMPADLPLGPGHQSQLFSPTKFVQYYADLESIDGNYRKFIESGMDERSASEKAFGYEVEYSSQDGPYPMSKLLVGDYVMLASELAENKTQWKEYLYRSFVSSGYKDS